MWGLGGVGDCGRGEGQCREKRRTEEKKRKLRKRANEKHSKGSVVVLGLLGVVWTMVFLIACAEGAVYQHILQVIVSSIREEWLTREEL